MGSRVQLLLGWGSQREGKQPQSSLLVAREVVDRVDRVFDVAEKVIAFMSQNHIDPDFAVETFILEPNAAD